MHQRRNQTIVLIAFMASLATPPALRAQPQGDATPVGADTPLPDKQTLVRERVSRLEDRMFQLHEALRKSEPDKAEKLLGALGTSRSLMVRQKIDAIIESLRNRQFTDAHDQQEAVAADLHALLKMLLEEPDHTAERQHEMERLRAARESLERVIEDQHRELREAQAAALAQTQLEALDAAHAALNEFLDRQAELRAAVEKNAAPPDAAAARQRRLADDATALAGRLHDMPREADSPITAAGEATQQAAEQMRAAAARLDEKASPEATAAQKNAEDALREAIEKINQQRQAAQASRPAPDQAADQEKTADDTQALGDDMKSDSAGRSSGDDSPSPDQSKDSAPHESDPSGGGQPQDDQSGEPESSDGEQSDGQSEPGNQSGEQKPLPGQQEVENAVPLQREAAERLKKNQPDQAAKKQAEALKKLQQAQEQLADTLEQLRKEQQEMLLAALETRFAAMLARQVETSRRTHALHEIGRANWKRTDQLALADLSAAQRWVSGEAEQALVILKEEGTTVVFPQIVEQVRDDSRDAGDHIASANVGEMTQTVQAGIEEALRELLEAIKKKQEDLQSGDDGAEGGQSPNQNPPLLPGSAELKLLRSCQLRVNTATALLDALRDEAAEAKRVGSEMERLSQRQKQVSDMARQMHESLTRPQ